MPDYEQNFFCSSSCRKVTLPSSADIAALPIPPMNRRDTGFQTSLISYKSCAGRPSWWDWIQVPVMWCLKLSLHTELAIKSSRSYFTVDRTERMKIDNTQFLPIMNSIAFICTYICLRNGKAEHSYKSVSWTAIYCSILLRQISSLLSAILNLSAAALQPQIVLFLDQFLIVIVFYIFISKEADFVTYLDDICVSD